MLVSEPVIHYREPVMSYALITVACQGDSKMPGGYGAILANIRPDLNFKS